ncbi:GNAT family N-acetyltransferase [Arthrobacter sp. AZCC_0090]|uniref:GNAT family N-acetyltransferase n=1 Tax=Arthrobacter sp. AZCC_0090 TaxID=2735881 RepID=UPI00160E1394|nr:GNAT family N-acetyltransferase [Arthrobacter sp. AZCC_0090]MBB6403528.1 ribosomal protein S18 acetylase RimI-like enzyme [Arthrobacter sp. AZCC_0090]
MERALRLRTPEDRDSGFLLDLFTSAAPGREFLPTSLLEMQQRAQHQQWSELWGGSGNVIVEFDGVPAGRIWTAWGTRDIRLVDIALLPAFRGAGLGGRLLGSICEAADIAGLDVRLAVARDNTGALALYQRSGFVAEEAGAVFLSLRRWHESTSAQAHRTS